MNVGSKNQKVNCKILSTLSINCQQFQLKLIPYSEFILCFFNGVSEIFYLSQNIVSRDNNDKLITYSLLLTSQIVILLIQFQLSISSIGDTKNFIMKLIIIYGSFEYSLQTIQIRGINNQYSIFQALQYLILPKIKNSMLVILTIIFLLAYLVIRALITESIKPYVITMAISIVIVFPLLNKKQDEQINNQLINNIRQQNNKVFIDISQQEIKIDEKTQNQSYVKYQDEQFSRDPLNIDIKDISNNQVNFHDEVKNDNDSSVFSYDKNSYIQNEQCNYGEQVTNQNNGSIQEVVFCKSILDNVSSGIILIDSNFQLLFKNKHIQFIVNQQTNQETLIEKILKLDIIKYINQRKYSKSTDQSVQIQQDEPRSKNIEIFGKNKYETSESLKTSNYKSNTNISKKIRPSIHCLNQNNNNLNQSRAGLIKNTRSSILLQNCDMEDSHKIKMLDNAFNSININKSSKKQRKQDQYKSMSQQELSFCNKNQQSIPQFILSRETDTTQEFNSSPSSPINDQLYNSFLPLLKNKSKSVSSKYFPTKLKKKVIPSSVLTLFNRENLNLYDILEYIFTKFDKIGDQNHWSSSDVSERAINFTNQNKDFQITNNITSEKQKNLNENIIYLLENNNLVIHFKTKQNDRGFIGLRIGFYSDIKEHDRLSGSKNNYVMIEFFDQSQLNQQINNKEINDYKNRMLASISHELRTPLNCSIQLLQVLTQKLQNCDIKQGLETDESLQQLYIIPSLNSNLLLLHIINDIVDYGQISMGNLNLVFSSLSLFDLVTECVDLIRFQAEQKNLIIEFTFDTKIQSEIFSDANRIRQVLLNLLSNSLKFTLKGSIKIKLQKESNDLIRVEVIDTGCGMPQKVIEKFFETFGNQESGKYLNTTGAGLGMSITNNLALGLGGNRRIQVKSKINEGTTFIFFIVDRGQNKQGCQYKMKDIFDQKLVKWETFTRQETNTTPVTLQSSKQIALGGMIKSVLNLQQITQEIHLTSLVKSDSTQSQVVFVSDSQKSFPDSYQNNSVTIINNAQQNLITATIKPIQQLPKEQKRLSDRLFSYLPFSNTQTTQLDFKDNKNIFNFKTNSRLLPSSIDTEDFISSELNPYKKDSLIASVRQTGKLQKVEEIINQIQLQGSHNILEQEEEMKKSYYVVNESNNKKKIHEYFKESKLNNQDQLSQCSSRLSTEVKEQQILSILESKESKNQLIQVESRIPHQTIIKSRHSFVGKLPYAENTSSPVSPKKINSQCNQKQEIINQLKIDSFQQGESPKKIDQQSNQKQNIEKLLKNFNLEKKCECPKILIVDDTHFNLYALSTTLKVYGFSVEKAESGIIAFEIIKQKFNQKNCCDKYPLILMDIDMPIMDGHETTKQILKFYEQNKSTPPIISACSAFVQESEKIKAQNSGMKYYITKPINKQDLENVLKICFLKNN